MVDVVNTTHALRKPALVEVRFAPRDAEEARKLHELLRKDVVVGGCVDTIHYSAFGEAPLYEVWFAGEPPEYYDEFNRAR